MNPDPIITAQLDQSWAELEPHVGDLMRILILGPREPQDATLVMKCTSIVALELAQRLRVREFDPPTPPPQID